MKSGMKWTDMLGSGQFRNLWVALDNCRYDKETLQPVEGDVVDSDPELTELCARLREKGTSSCAILYCDEDVIVESQRLSQIPAERRSAAR